MGKRGGTTLLLVDCQKDFHPGGSLAIPTANEDADRIANLIRRHAGSIDRIVATMDSHHKLHIAHPSFWESGGIDNEHPAPFTIISTNDIVSGKWKPRDHIKMPVGEPLVDAAIFQNFHKVVDSDGTFNLTKYCIEYTRQLEAKGRFKLCIWPEHCLIGSDGHCVENNIQSAMLEWSEKTGGSIEWVLKGENLLTEMYSALAADVPISSLTSFNQDLQNTLLLSDRLLVCGQAMSHCVNYTLRDIVNHWPRNSMAKISLLTDCASAVPGFEAVAIKFQEDMKAAGINLCSAAEVFSP